MWPFSSPHDRLPTVPVFGWSEQHARALDGSCRPDVHVDPLNPLPLAGLNILHLGFKRNDRLLLTETMRILGARNVASSEQVSPLGLGRPGSLRYDGVVVNLDRFGEAEVGVDRMLRFRRAHPTCLVVIATAGVASDDLGHHRRAICDSTLRLPLTARRLTEALIAGLQNHGASTCDETTRRAA